MKFLFDELLGDGELSQGSLDFLAPYLEAEIVVDSYCPVIIRHKESYHNFINNKRDSLITLDEKMNDSVRSFLIYAVLRQKYNQYNAAELIHTICYVISTGSIGHWVKSSASANCLKELDELTINTIIEERLKLEKSNSNFILRTFLELLNVKP